MQRFSIISLSFVAVCLLFLVGCGGDDDLPPNYQTAVEVTYQGQPVDKAMVTLRPDGHEAPSATGVTDSDGKVQLFSFKGKGKGVIPGKYLVGIEKQEVESAQAIDSSDPNYGAAVDEEETRKERVDVLPAKYISAATSELTCTVTEDPSQNEFKFDLED